MENTNGVKIIREHCEKCMCRKCEQRVYTYKANSHVKCPYGNNVCLRCDKREYVEDCLFRI